MTVVEYIGSSDVRIISEQILTGAGFTVPGGIRWDKANQFRVDIADNMLVAYLLAQGVFQTEDQETFVGSLNGTYVSEDEADAFWVPADTFITHAGVPAISSFAIGYPAFLMDAASDEQVSGSFLMPEWFTTVDVKLVWANAGVGAGDVAWRVVYTQNNGPAASFNAGAVAPTGVTATAAGQYVRVDTQVVAGAAVTGNLWGFRAWRDADAVADTLANDAAFVGLLIERAT